MSVEKLKNKLQEILISTGIIINGDKPWDIKIYNEDFYQRLFLKGSLGLGESYMEGWWDCERLDEFFVRIHTSTLETDFKKNLPFFLYELADSIFNFQAYNEAFNVGKLHYDIGNDLYRSMLDERLVYTCAYWENVHNLNQAQEAKLDLVCRKLNLQPGQYILDLGCGWGSFAKYAAEKYKVKVLGITISQQQVELGRKLCEGLPVELRFQDYRKVTGTFDHIVSLGMFEHVGPKNYREYFQIVRRLLKEDGLFLLHTIGANKSLKRTDPWIDKYIFPGGVIPSIKQIGEATEKLFVMEDWHNFGLYYDLTLMAWHGNFTENWHKIKDNYDEKFYRMWRYYLLISAASFRARKNQLWQIVLSPKGLNRVYRAGNVQNYLSSLNQTKSKPFMSLIHS